MILLNGERIEITHFPDHAPSNTVEPQSKHCTIEWRYENDAEAMFVWYLAKHLREGATNARTVDLFLPYLVCARQDRVKYEKDIFYLKYLADFINSMKFDTVTCFDIHSMVGEALINNLVVLSPKALINKVLEILWREYQIQSPLAYLTDFGSVKRCSDLISIPFLYGRKVRDWNTREITGLEIEKSNPSIDVAGRDILIIDDIISSGTTILKGAEKLKELGANRLFVYASHCENRIYGTALYNSNLIEKIYTTNSILMPFEDDNKIQIMDYRMAQAYRGHPERR